MGYNTQYNLEVQPPKVKTPEEIIAELRTLSSDASYAIANDGGFVQEVKWYDHEKEILEFSRIYPTHLFVLHGKGDDGEQWIKYFRNGKIQVAEAVVQFEPFDEAKMK